MLRQEVLEIARFAWFPMVLLLWYVGMMCHQHFEGLEDWLESRIRQIQFLELTFGVVAGFWVGGVSFRCLFDIAGVDEPSMATTFVLSWAILFDHLCYLRRWEQALSKRPSVPIRE